MKKYYEVIKTRTQEWYRIFEEKENGEYAVIEKTSDKLKTEGLTEAFKVGSILAEIHEGGEVIKVGARDYLVNSKLDKGYALAAVEGVI